jgi:GxxExxY protein
MDDHSGRFLDGSDRIIGACIEVHRRMGPGLLESVYEQCLCIELRHLGIPFQRQVKSPLYYRGVALDGAFRLDLLIEERLIVEVKSVEALLPVHQAQAMSYLRFTGLRTALLINFNVPSLRAGLRRLTRTSSSDPNHPPLDPSY